MTSFLLVYLAVCLKLIYCNKCHSFEAVDLQLDRQHFPTPLSLVLARALGNSVDVPEVAALPMEFLHTRESMKVTLIR